MGSRDYFVWHTPRLFANFIKPAAHKPLDGIHGILGIRHRLPLCDLADQPLARLSNCHYGRGRPCPFLVGDYHRFATLHHGDDRVRGSQVNSNNLTHCCRSS